MPRPAMPWNVGFTPLVPMLPTYLSAFKIIITTLLCFWFYSGNLCFFNWRLLFPNGGGGRHAFPGVSVLAQVGEVKVSALHLKSSHSPTVGWSSWQARSLFTRGDSPWQLLGSLEKALVSLWQPTLVAGRESEMLDSSHLRLAGRRQWEGREGSCALAFGLLTPF